MTQQTIRVLTVSSALVLTFALSLTSSGLFLAYPTYLYVAELMGLPQLLVPVLVGAIFTCWCIHLLRRTQHSRRPFPRRSFVLAAIGLPLSAAYYRFQWNWAETYIPSLLYSTAFISFLAFTAAAVAVAFAVRTRAASLDLVAHFLLFIWLTIYGFPYLGEPV